jgi:hypothetical protein
VKAAWLGGIAEWRGKRAADERNLGALRSFAELGNMGSAPEELPKELLAPLDLVNATLAQFEVPADMESRTVFKELLKELDTDLDDLADDARGVLEEGVARHLAYRSDTARSRLSEMVSTVRGAIAPALRGGQGGGGGDDDQVSLMLPRPVRHKVERLVGTILNQLPGVLGSNEEALEALLAALNITSQPSATQSGLAANDDAGKDVAPASIIALLRDAASTHCEGLRRQAARESAIRSLQRLLAPGVHEDDPVPISFGDDDDDDDDGAGHSTGAADAADDAADVAAQAAKERAAEEELTATWAEGASLVQTVYGGYEEQAREMSAVELLLDVLRMAQLTEDDLRKSDRGELEAAVDGFRRALRSGAQAEPTVADDAHVRRAIDREPEGLDALQAAGWRRATPLGDWAKIRVSALLRDGGGDGSDFALVLAALLHSIGAKVRVSIICLPPSKVPFVDASASDSSEQGGPACRMLTEARVGLTPTSAADWVARRHGLGLGARGELPPRLHFRREAAGDTWLSLAWQPLPQLRSGGIGSSEHRYEQQPGGAYLPTPLDKDDGSAASEWTTFYPFDEHGCKWHVRGAEADSAGHVHGSASAASVDARSVPRVG